MAESTASQNSTKTPSIEELYNDQDHWHVNTGGETIHAKRMGGLFRNLKWWAASVWLLFFLGPYLRWGDRQAILFDIEGRQFHIFNITILPQDVWMLALLLLFFAILLAVVTSIAGRVYCGYFCFQTVWVDVFTLIEEKLEGNPAQRRKLDKEPLSLRKATIKTVKHTIWLLIGILTGVSFTLWFTDAREMWHDFFTLQASTIAWGTVFVFAFFTHLFAAFMREQVCFWLCPYARIQGVMVDEETILPAYDIRRGEPRGKLKKGEVQEGHGDCVSCNLCVAVCPTGGDIRDGQQEGCITCGLCIDACNEVMDKIDKPHGLIRYASLDAILGKPTIPTFKRPRVLVYTGIMLLSLIGIIYGMFNLGSVELKVLHERQPLFVRQSDGSIQNKYELKILNKTDRDINFLISAHGPDQLVLVDNVSHIHTKFGTTNSHTIFVRVPNKARKQEIEPIEFTITAEDNSEITTSYESMFIGPKP
ncbi:MAG: cytochrome c oxidase accessory protein CcoG [Gammaproteobacteria bacterium]|nr:cytochrome c oxidase accessory protein CcoG [Gammaproteobacteria bacterium]